MRPTFVELDFSEYPQQEMVRRARTYFDEMRRRRSVREFSARPFPLEVIEQCIRTAGSAPSGAHKQPWHFVVVSDEGVKGRIREAAEAEERRNYGGRMPPEWLEDLEPLGTDWRKPFLSICPYLVVVFAESYRVGEGSVRAKNYYVQESVGIAVGMLLAALHHAGAATLTHTPSPMGFLARILQRPSNERAFMLIATGYPAPGCRVPDLRRKPLSGIMTHVHKRTGSTGPETG